MWRAGAFGGFALEGSLQPPALCGHTGALAANYDQNVMVVC
jgi:hypothetical protein